MVWPAAPAASANNFLDDFAGSSLNARWGSLVSGGSTLSVSGSVVDFTSPAGTAAAAYLTSKVDLTRYTQLTFCWSSFSVTTGPSNIIYVYDSPAAPVVDTYANFNNNVRTYYAFKDQAAVGAHCAFYFDGSQNLNHWDGSAQGWNTTTSTHMASPLAANPAFFRCILEIDGPNSRLRWTAEGLAAPSSSWTFEQGIRRFAMTDWLPFSSTKGLSNCWIVIGNPYNSNGFAQHVQFDYVRYADIATPLDVFLACKPNTAGAHQIRRAQCASDLQCWQPTDRTSWALTLGSSGAWDASELQTPFCVTDGTTDAMFYDGTNASGVRAIGVATATYARPQTGTWTKYAGNPILSKSATGTAQDDADVAFPCVVIDSSGGSPVYNLLYAGKSSVDGLWRTFLATATAATGPYTKQGKIIDVGGSGAFDQLAARDCVVVRYAGQWYVFYEGWNSANLFGLGLAKGTSFTSLVKDGGSPYWTPNTSAADQALTANLAGNTATVASATNFRKNAWLILQQGAGTPNQDNYTLDRVGNGLTSTTIPLQNGQQGYTTTSPAAKIKQIDSVPNWSPRWIAYDATDNLWYFLMNAWESFTNGGDGSSYSTVDEGGGFMTLAGASPAGTPTILDLSFKAYNFGDSAMSSNDYESSENATFFTPAFTGDPNTPVALTLTQATSPLLGKGAGKSFALGQAQVALLTKQPAKLFSLAQAQAAVLGKQASKGLTLTQAQAAILTKQATKLLGPLGQATTASLQAIKTHLVSLTIVQATAAGMQRGVALTRSLAQVTQPALVKAVALPLALSQAAIAVLNAAKQSGGTTINLVVTQPTQAALTKAAALSRLVGQATLPTLGKATGKSLALVQSSTAQLSALRVKLITLTVQQPTVAGIGRGVGKALSVGQGGLATVGKATAKGLQASAGTVASLVAQGGGAGFTSVQTLYARARQFVLKVVSR